MLGAFRVDARGRAQRLRWKEQVEPYLGQIRLFSFEQLPVGWMPCDGQLLSIDENQELFSLIGTAYGGDGKTTFAVPNLQGRLPIHIGAGTTLGETGGELAHALSLAEIPKHVHTVTATPTDGDNGVTPDSECMLAADADGYLYSTSLQSFTPMSPAMIATTGESQPHENCMPFLVLCYCIFLQDPPPPRG